jgi:N-acetylated-alpha-linked acidic dipeptidase
METAHALAKMVKQGWRPKRTIILASWDAEEWGLIGSTEWAEKHGEELREKAVLYLNTDSNRQGVLQVEGSHTLERFVNDIARDLEDPRTGKSVWQVMKDERLKGEKDEEKKKSIAARADLRIGALGSGSDYTVFLDHLTVASINLSFRGDGGGVYHSIYDSFDWYRRFGDPEFVYGRALAQYNAVALARMAGASVLPMEFTNLADTLTMYLDEIEKLQKDKAKTAPQASSLDLEPLKAAVKKLDTAAQDYEQTLGKGFKDGGPSGDTSRVNAALRKVEQSVRLPEGLPDREWFKHAFYAPGFYTGYGVKTIPGVREAIEQERWDIAARQADVVRHVIETLTAQIRTAETELQALL